MPPVEWRVESGLTAYPDAVALMEDRAAAIAEQREPELVWLVEHPPIYTAGTSSNDRDLLDARFPVFKTGRGGQFTYHGPGQRVGYVMLDLKQRGSDVRGFVHDLEEWLIRTLAAFNVKGERRGRPRRHLGGRARTAQEIRRPRRQDRRHRRARAQMGDVPRRLVQRVDPEVSPDFTGIVPCGISEHGVTSLHDLGILASMADVDVAMKAAFRGSLRARNLG